MKEKLEILSKVSGYDIKKLKELIEYNQESFNFTDAFAIIDECKKRYKLSDKKKKKSIKKSNKTIPPLFIKMVSKDGKNLSALRLIIKSDYGERSKYVYHRDAGGWDVGYKYVEGKLKSKNLYGKDMSYLSNNDLIEVTFEEWKKDNEGYVNGYTVESCERECKPEKENISRDDLPF